MNSGIRSEHRWEVNCGPWYWSFKDQASSSSSSSSLALFSTTTSPEAVEETSNKKTYEFKVRTNVCLCVPKRRNDAGFFAYCPASALGSVSMLLILTHSLLYSSSSLSFVCLIPFFEYYDSPTWVVSWFCVLNSILTMNCVVPLPSSSSGADIRRRVTGLDLILGQDVRQFAKSEPFSYTSYPWMDTAPGSVGDLITTHCMQVPILHDNVCQQTGVTLSWYRWFTWPLDVKVVAKQCKWACKLELSREKRRVGVFV